MQTQSSFPRTAARWARRHWLVLAAVAIATIFVLGVQPVWAADGQPQVNQTVPPPTPRPTAPSPQPGDDNDNDNNDENNAEATAEPTAAATDAATGATLADVSATSPYTAVVQAVTLNVRQGPGTGYAVAGKLTQGTVVSVQGRNDAGDWWYVCCMPGSGGQGWVSASLVTPSFSADQASALAPVQATAAPATTPAVGGTAANVNAVTLNVRSEPSTDAQVLGKLRQGDAVSVLGRNATGDWLQVCCIAGSQTQGWVSAQYVTPAFTADALPVVEAAPAATAEVTATTTETTTETAATAAVVTETVASGAVLDVAIEQQPPFAVQGKEIALVFTIRNAGGDAAENVALNNLLPAGLTLVNATASASGAVTTDAGAGAVDVVWPSIAGGESVVATVRVKVAEDVANGAAFDEVATVTADNAEGASAGITIGMPPALLPEFW